MGDRGLSWLVGAAILAAVVTAAVHFSEGREFARLIDQVEPWWVALALALQIVTYLAQAEVFRIAPLASGVSLPRRWLLKLSFAKLFIDQTLPSAGISSTVLVVRVLRARGVSRGAVAATAMINIGSYHAAYVVCLITALAVAARLDIVNAVIAVISALFVAFGIGMTVLALGISRRSAARLASLSRFRLLTGIIELLNEAEPRFTRNPRILITATTWQIVTFIADSTTMWVLIQSLGAAAPAAAVFASFMISSLIRTVGIVPGGLGTYEAASVVTLQLTGLTLPEALSATLLFRVLTFWLPMLPGFYSSRRLVQESVASRHPAPHDYWALDPASLVTQLESGPEGLASSVAAARLQAVGANRLRAQRTHSRMRALARQLRNPLLFLLVFAAVISAVTGEWIDASIVLVIVAASVGIGASREYLAETAVEALQAQVRMKTNVLRDGRIGAIGIEEVVPGDVVMLSAGSLVPGDGVLLEATDFFVSESVLTGESFPVEKKPGAVAATASVRDRTNCVFLGTNVRSGSARCVVVGTGAATEFGRIAAHLARRAPETEFERGIRSFGYLLTSVMLVLVFCVFVAHVLQGRPPGETLLFSVALAVGLSPELLPAILSVNLARGAQMMARHGVVVRRLNAIENLGSMDVLCTDKTGTLTEGVIHVGGSYDACGDMSPRVLTLAAVNATFETGLSNPLDEALLRAETPDVATIRKIGEIPFDFVRKRISVIVQETGGTRLITKGAFDAVLDACTHITGSAILDRAARVRLRDRYEAWTREGIRVLAVATRSLECGRAYTRADEADLTFEGFITFLDRPKEGISNTLSQLACLGVAVKLITGDSKLVAQHLATLVGMRADRVLTGEDLRNMHDDALWRRVEDTDLFVEVDPNQKERIITSLKKRHHVVGFLGDGVNDAPAMHVADTSMSVDTAADVARAAADLVLLERDLDVIRRGIEEGRKTFANTMKYVLTTTSANMGNMLSMAVASLFLPFLPLLAGQILLNNFLSDIPAIGIADDAVDQELIARPERWNMRFIGRFMVEFGLLSSIFDVLTFVALLLVFAAPPAVFRTAWFIESLLTELVIALVVRTRRPFLRSRPGSLLLWSTLALIPLTFVIPFLPFAAILGFTPISASICAMLVGITVLYVLAAETGKARFYRAG